MSVVEVLTGLSLLLMMLAIASGRYATDLIFLFGVLLNLLFGTVSVEEAFRGFASESVLTVGFFYVIMGAVRSTGGLEWLVAPLRGAKTEGALLRRLTLGSFSLSTCMNNTPVVAAGISMAMGVVRPLQVPVSRVLMPISFASILGGCCTLIGTSSTIVADSILRAAGHGGLHLFSVTPVALVNGAFGLTYLLIASRRLLPDTAARAEAGGAMPREYIASARVLPDSGASGQSVESAGLRGLPGLFLAGVEREGATVDIVGGRDLLATGDILHFAGDVTAMDALVREHRLGTITADEEAGALSRWMDRVIEVVVPSTSSLVGRSVRESQIRSRYDAAVVSVHRKGARIEGRIGDVVIRPGDYLALAVRDRFMVEHASAGDFVIITPSDGAGGPTRHAGMAVAVLLVTVVCIGLGILRPVESAMAGACAVVALGCTSAQAARSSVSWEVLLIIGASLGLGAAVENSGLAQHLSGLLRSLAIIGGTHLALAGLYLFTLMMSMFMGNAAAVVVALPIALPVASAIGLSPAALTVTTAIAAACDFSTPFGYQTNLMVMGPGGYRIRDFARLGAPLTALVGAITVSVVPLFFS